MKKRYIVLLTVLGVIASVIFHFAATQFFCVVANYEALSLYELAGLPMFMFVASMITIMFFLYRLLALKRDNAYTKRFYALLVLIFSAIGAASSLFVGLGIYKNLFARYVFLGYPFVMLLANVAVLAAAIYYFVANNKVIKLEKPEKPARSKARHVFATMGFTFLIIFSFVNVGSLFLMPMQFSPVDGYLALPLFFQYAVPFAALSCFLIYRDFMPEEKKAKFGLIANCVIFGFSLCTFIYMIVATKVNYPAMINATTNTLFLERLVTFPVSFIFLYGISLVFPAIYLVRTLIRKLIKAK